MTKEQKQIREARRQAHLTRMRACNRVEVRPVYSNYYDEEGNVVAAKYLGHKKMAKHVN